jgi:RNase P/RNase MRP subunit p29
MKSVRKLIPVLLLVSPLALAAGPKTYQVTGPVLDVTDNSVVVQKGKEKWEIARDASTKVTGELKKGEKVTVEYRMTATAIDVKSGAKKK